MRALIEANSPMQRTRLVRHPCDLKEEMVSQY